MCITGQADALGGRCLLCDGAQTVGRFTRASRTAVAVNRFSVTTPAEASHGAPARASWVYRLASTKSDTRVFHYDVMRTNAFGGSGSRGQSQGNRNGQHDLLHGKLQDWPELWRIPPPKDVTAITKERFCRGAPRIRCRESRSIRPVEQLDGEPAGSVRE